MWDKIVLSVYQQKWLLQLALALPDHLAETDFHQTDKIFQMPESFKMRKGYLIALIYCQYFQLSI